MAAPRSPTAVVNAMNASLNAHGVARGTPNFNSRHTAADLYSNSKWPLPAGAGAAGAGAAGAAAAAAAAAAGTSTVADVLTAINAASEMAAGDAGKQAAKEAAIAIAGRLDNSEARKVELQGAANAIDVAAAPAAAMTGGRRRGRKSRKATKKSKKSKKSKKTKKAKKSRKTKGRK